MKGYQSDFFHNKLYLLLQQKNLAVKSHCESTSKNEMAHNLHVEKDDASFGDQKITDLNLTVK
jgi:hypothetical protein